MATYYSSTIQKGSQSDDVKVWQAFLRNQGYNISVDGIFGDNTEAATKKYQQANGLTVDGIVGANTWGKAGYTPKSTGSGDGWSYDDFKYDDFTYEDYKAPDKFEYDDFTYKDYEESDAVKNAGTALNDHLANKPAEYQSQWQSQLDSLMDQIMNRDKFSYDMNGDALYQQYKDKYIQQGKMAMGDAIGQASAMTGGYGNSYAQSVGQQAYQAQLQNLNDIVPQLYAMALDQYNQEGQNLYNQYGMVADRESQDYGRYRDTVSDYLTERDYLQGRYDSERDFDYSKYNNERNFAYGQYADDRNFAYGQYADDRTFDYNQYVADRGFAYDKYSSDRGLAYDEYATDKNLSYDEYRNAIEDEQWQKEFDATQEWKQKEFDEAVRQYNEDMAFQKQKYADDKLESGYKDDEKEGGTQPTETKRTTDFINRFMIKSEYLARGKSEKDWFDYMESNIASFLRDDRINESEALYLIEYYKIP